MRESTSSPSSTNNTSTPPSVRQHHRLPLSCRECQRKKVRCDRSYPCGQCSRAGHSCTPSTRKPRAKVGSRAVDIELRNRIAKLEKLVETFQGDEYDERTSDPESKGPPESESDPLAPGVQPPSSGTDHNTVAFTGLRAPHADEAPTSNPSGKYAVGSFLSTLTTEVQALREAFEEGDLDDDYDGLSSEPTPPQAPNVNDPSNPASGSYELLLCPPGALFVMPGVLSEPGVPIFMELCSMYLAHMEPFQKIFHLPTLEAFLFRGENYLGNDSEAPCNRAVKAAICFAGLAAMREDETVSRFGKSRDKLVTEYRRMVDVAIYQTDPMNTTEIAALQALVLYSAAIRMIEATRRGWTLLGLITRIARALNIHREAPNEPIYKRELCRRLWYYIVYLDCYATLDRGTEPAISASVFERPLPTNCNDADFSETSTWLQAREGEITDTSFSLVCFEAASMVVRLSSTSIHTQDSSKPVWQHRLELANSFSRTIDTRVLRFCDPAIPAQRLLIAVGKSAAHSMVLRAVRPLEPHITTCAHHSPPHVSTMWVLQLANVILQHNKDMDADGETTACWRRMPWVPWHAIAVALAGLCSIRDNVVADEAWILIEGAMKRHAGDVADSRTGMLWKPIEKLRRRAALFRDEGVRLTQAQKYAQQQQQQQQQRQTHRQVPTIPDNPATNMAPPQIPPAVQPPTNAWAPPITQQQQHQPQHPARTVSLGRKPGMRIEMPSGVPSFAPSPAAAGIAGDGGAAAAAAAPLPPILTPIASNTAESSFLDFPPDMLASVPDEGSWLDWEAIMKDMDEVNAAAAMVTDPMQMG